MAKAKNQVIAGDFAGRKVTLSFGRVSILMNIGSIEINRNTVESYELVADTHQKSIVSGVARGVVGGALLGPAGMLAGGLSAKSKGIYNVAIQFQDDPKATCGGKRCLLEVDDSIYNAILKNCF